LHFHLTFLEGLGWLDFIHAVLPVLDFILLRLLLGLLVLLGGQQGLKGIEIVSLGAV
jgi:hypothetical protein